MFERICIRPNWSSGPAPFDAGVLAESLLYYGRVEVVVGPAEVDQLVRAVGPEEIVELLEQEYLGVNYRWVMSGLQSSGSSPRSHTVVQFRGDRTGLQNLGPEVFIRATGRDGKGRRLGRRFVARARATEFDRQLGLAMTDDLRDGTFVRSAIEAFLKTAAPSIELQPGFRFDVMEIRDGEFVIESNLDVNAVTAEWRRHRPRDCDLIVTPEWLLVHAIEARENLDWASRLDAEMALDPVSSAVAQLKIESVLAKRARSATQIGRFEESMFDEGRSVGEAIRSGSRSFRDVLTLLSEARRWKTWLREAGGGDNDVHLVREYLKAIGKTGWAEGLPFKALRFVSFTAAGLGLDAVGAGGVGTAAGVLLGAADAFLLDKLIAGWKPSQFVDGPLSEFVSAST